MSIVQRMNCKYKGREGGRVGRMGGWMDGCVGGWLNKTGRLGTAMPVITQKFVFRTAHDVDRILVSEEGKYFIHK